MSYRTAILVSIIFLLTSCIRENFADCPSGVDVELEFSYYGDSSDPAMFLKSISKIDLFVYEKSGRLLYDRKTYNKEYLDYRQGASLDLLPGEYRIVSWANAKDLTDISDSKYFDRASVTAALHTDGCPTGNDHLYFSCIDLSIPDPETLPEDSVVVVRREMQHISSHVNIELYVKGFADKNVKDSYPIIRMTNLMPEYNFLMEDVGAYGTTYLPEVRWNDAVNGVCSVFQTLRFPDNSAIEVVIVNPSTNAERARLDLTTFLKENRMRVETLHEATVRILFEFTELGLGISIPDWGIADTSPEI